MVVKGQLILVKGARVIISCYLLSADHPQLHAQVHPLHQDHLSEGQLHSELQLPRDNLHCRNSLSEHRSKSFSRALKHASLLFFFYQLMCALIRAKLLF